MEPVPVAAMAAPGMQLYPAAAAGVPGPAAGEVLEMLPAADEKGRCMVYLVTFSALLPGTAEAAASGHELCGVNGLSRGELRDAVLKAVAEPAFDQNTRGGGGLGNDSHMW